MGNSKLNSQKGAMSAWAIIAGIVVIAGIGYFIYSSQANNGGIAPNNGTDTSSANTLPPSGTQSGNGPDNTSGSSGSGSVSQSLNCNSYITASDIAGALNLSSQTTITAKTYSSGSGCVISWKDPSKNPIAPTIPNSTGIINMAKSIYAATTATNLCKGKTSLGIGEVSCAGPTGTNPDGSIIFAKSGFIVTMSKISPSNVPGGLAAIARMIAGNL